MDVFDRTLRVLCGECCWGAEYSRLLNLSLSFGEPAFRVVREPYNSRSRSETVRLSSARRVISVKGRWWLWLGVSYWRLSLKVGPSVRSSSSTRRITRGLRMLEGQRLVEATVSEYSGATRFVFDLGAALDVRRTEADSDDELWLLYKPNGYVLSVRANATYDHEPGSGIDRRKGVSRRPIGRPVRVSV